MGTVAPDPGRSEESLSLFEHARRLREQHPDEPLPRDGHPFPDAVAHDRRSPRPPDSGLKGAAAADILARYFDEPSDDLTLLEGALHAVDVPIHHNDHIRAIAFRSDGDLVRHTGRRLVLEARDRCAAVIGLALLAVNPTDDDIDLIRTIGLLSERFASLASEALLRLRHGHESLLWLAERSSGWGRFYYLEALCKGAFRHRDWLLRHSCDGDFLDGYFAGTVAVEASLHEAIVRPDADDELVDHTGMLLSTMAGAGGMGIDLAKYPPAAIVLGAYTGHLAKQEPSGARARVALALGHALRSREAVAVGCTEQERQNLLNGLDETLNLSTWVTAAAEQIDWAGEWGKWARTAFELPPGLRVALEGSDHDGAAGQPVSGVHHIIG
ncbi:hypothetical protein [Myceligenerans crystallogenes]|uniref:hypothetical protein n=1 Tax=Myceligenerans crystallogenes TaxID=316335 RepID=UPI0031D83FE1